MTILLDMYKKGLDHYGRFGLLKTLLLMLGQIANRLIGFDCLHIIAVHRSRIIKPGSDKGGKLESRLATEEDLLDIKKEENGKSMK